MAQPLLQGVNREDMRNKTEVIIVGAGVFGCAMAYALGEQGRSVLLLERSLKEPNRIVGELLQPGGYRTLRRLGLESCLKDIDAQPVYGYQITLGIEHALAAYPYVDTNGRVRTDHEQGSDPSAGHERTHGFSFHHGRFITQLRRACSAHSNITVIEAEVMTMIEKDDDPTEIVGVEARLADTSTGQKIQSRFLGKLTIVADGYASRFRSKLIRRKPVVLSRFYALELTHCRLQTAGHAWVIVGKDGPVLLYQLSSTTSRMLIDVPIRSAGASQSSSQVPSYIRSAILPILPDSVRSSVESALAERKTLRSMPNSWLPPTAQTSYRGAVVFGDAMNMRHALGGGGMTVALNDVALMAEILAPKRIRDLGHHVAVRAAMKEVHRRRKSLTINLDIIANALHCLFAASDHHLRALQFGCFAYLRCGYTTEPLGMIGGVICQPTRLAHHLLLVAWLGVYLHARKSMDSPWKLWKLPLVFVDAILILYRACVVLLPTLLPELV